MLQMQLMQRHLTNSQINTDEAVNIFYPENTAKHEIIK